MSTPTLEQDAPVATAVTASANRAVQLAIRARLLIDVAKLWPVLDPKRLDETWPGWIGAMKQLVELYHGQSAAAAARFYRSARQLHTESPAPHSLIRLAPMPADDWMDRAFGYSGPGLIKQDKVRPNTALSTTMGTASRIVQSGGQNTIVATVDADPVALGWYRVTDGKPCAFCALLASRGVVYKDGSFDASNAKFEGAGEFKVHNDCGCTAAPAFTRDHELPEVNRVALEVYRGRGKGPALPAFRKAWAEHLAKTA